MIFAVIRLKGEVNVRKELEDTMAKLRLHRKHHCILVEANKSVVNMINRLQGYVTWGEISPASLSVLLQKRGRLPGNQRLTEEYVKAKTGKTIEKLAEDMVSAKVKLKEVPGLKPVFRLKPPTKGFERFGMKRPYSLGGAVGYRGKDINELLQRMI